MQMQIFRKVVLGLMVLGLTLGTLAIFGCGGDDNEEVQRQANLQGANERAPNNAPSPVNTPGSGTAVLTINDDQTEIGFVLTYNNLTNVTQAHIHVGSADVSGPIVLFYCTNVGGAPAGTVGGQACPQGASVTVTGTLKAVDLIPRAATPSTPEATTFDQVIALLVNGTTYSNVHTQANPGGEIRAQNL
jgi:CHRD domain